MSYMSTHNKVRQVFGKASEYRCEHCDMPACEWALAHDTQGLEPTVDSLGRAYSKNPSDYIPLCKPCHQRFDKECGLTWMRGSTMTDSSAPNQSAIYDPARDNLSCHLPIDRLDEIWTRSCKVWCAMCDTVETFWVVTGIPTNEAANLSLSEVMSEAGWTYGGEDGDDDFCPDCSRVGA